MVLICYFLFQVAFWAELISVVKIVIAKVMLRKHPDSYIFKRLGVISDWEFAVALAIRGICAYRLGAPGEYVTLLGIGLGIYTSFCLIPKYWKH